MRAKHKSLIFILVTLAALAALLFVVSGCGEETATTGFECDKSAPSILPKPSGRPQLVEFYADT